MTQNHLEYLTPEEKPAVVKKLASEVLDHLEDILYIQALIDSKAHKIKLINTGSTGVDWDETISSILDEGDK